MRFLKEEEHEFDAIWIRDPHIHYKIYEAVLIFSESKCISIRTSHGFDIGMKTGKGVLYATRSTKHFPVRRDNVAVLSSQILSVCKRHSPPCIGERVREFCVQRQEALLVKVSTASQAEVLT